MKNLSRVYLIFIIALYLFISFITFNQIEEDTFIYFRLAENIASGHGYVFNAGGEHIESGSGLIWQGLISLLFFLPLNSILTTKLLCVGFGCFALVLMYCISKKCITDTYLQFAPSTLLAVSIPFYFWSQRGLETPFYVCAILALVYICLDKQLYRYWHVGTFILFCSRPEGFFVCLAIVPFLLHSRKCLPHFRRDCFVLFCGLCGITIFRIYYFHEIFPHTFYIRMGGGFIQGLYGLRQYMHYSFLFFLIVPAIPALFVKRFWRPPLLVLGSFFILTAFWSVLGGYDIFKAYDFERKIIPFLCFLFFLICMAYDTLYKNKFKLFVTIGLCVCAFSILFFSKPVFRAGHDKPYLFLHTFLTVAASPIEHVYGLYCLFSREGNPDAGTQYCARPLYTNIRKPIGINFQATAGKFIKLNYPKNISIIHDQMGQTPWYAGPDKNFTDSFGLTDRTLGLYSFGQRFHASPMLSFYNSVSSMFFKILYPRENRHISEKQALDYIFNKKAELILIHKDSVTFLPDSLPAKMQRDSRLKERYTLKYNLNDMTLVYEARDFTRTGALNIPDGCVVHIIAED